MNGVCAGGTGSFIDHMASLLSTDAPGLNALAEKGKQIYTIASRCGVFAKTDIQALMNDGAEKADIALSVLQAVVNQTIGNLAQGRPIGGRVAFLGGPLHFLPELRKRFIETLKLDDEHVVKVDNGNYFVAMGAALSEESREICVGDLESSMERAKEAAAAETRKADFTLFEDAADYEAFRARHDRNRVKRGDFATYAGPVCGFHDNQDRSDRAGERTALYILWQQSGLALEDRCEGNAGAVSGASCGSAYRGRLYHWLW